MKDLFTLFANIEEISPTSGLEFFIAQRIEMESQRQLKRKLIYSYLETAISALLLLYTGFVFGQMILQSEFWSLASLFFSDMGTVLVNWQDFTYSLMENFPIFSLLAILVPIIMVLYFFGRDVDLYQQSKHKLANY